MKYLLLVAISMLLSACGENHAGGTVEIPNGIQASTLKDTSGSVLPHHELAFVGVNDTAFNPEIYYSNTNELGQFETDILPTGKYRLFVNDSSDKLGSATLFEKASDTVIFDSLLHLEPLQEVNFKLPSGFDHEGWIGFAGSPHWVEINNKNEFTLPKIQPYNYRILFENQDLETSIYLDSVEVIEKDLEITHLGKVEVLQGLASDDIKLYYQSFLQNLGIDFISLDSNANNNLSQFKMILPGSKIPTSQLEQIAIDSKPILTLDAQSLVPLGMPISKEDYSWGIESNNRWQSIADTLIYPFHPLNESVVIYDEAIQEKDSIVWARIGANAVQFGQSNNTPNHAMAFWQPQDTYSVIFQENFSSHRVLFGAYQTHMSPEAKNLLSFLIYKLLEDKVPSPLEESSI